MGYVLNALASLPVDDRVHFYIFAINGQFREPLYEMVENNFFEIAKSIGRNAVIAIGTDKESFSTSVAERYFGEDIARGRFLDMLPALLITNDHPDKLTRGSARFVIPLREAESRFGGWHQFFSLLSQFVRGESDEFIRRFESADGVIDKLNKVVQLRPGFFGIGVNLNQLIEWWIKSKASQI